MHRTGLQRTMRDFMLATALGLSSLAGTGCAYFAEYPELPPAERASFVNPDLPVPTGFALDRGSSLRHERSSYRKLRLLFQREEYINDDRVVEFVKNAYQQEGWKLDFQYGLEQVKFIFHKGAEECRVEVLEDMSDRMTQFVVEVEPWTTPDGGAVARAEWGTDAFNGRMTNVPQPSQPTTVAKADK